MLGSIRGEVSFKEPLNYHTSLRVGGPADIFVVAQDVDDVRHALLFARREQLPITIIGGGNSVLVRDRGVRGVTLKLGGCLARSEFQGDEAVVGAGVSLSSLIREAAAHDLGGLEGFAGVAATLGGALKLNVRGADQTMSDLTSAVYVLRCDGILDEFKIVPGTGGSRGVHVPHDTVVVGCRLRLKRRPFAEIRKDVSRRLVMRKRSEPLALASARIWQDPPGGIAAQLIEQSGLKGKRVNGAEIATKDPNFIINRGSATASDVEALMALTRERVDAKAGVLLKERVSVIGE